MDTKFFDDLSVTLSKTAKELGVKAEGFVGKQKTRGQILAEERAAERALAAIGKVIFDRFTEGAELEEELEDLCVEVKNHYDKIAVLKESIAEKSNKKYCPSCGKAMAKDAAFCSSCGAAFPEEEEEEILEEEVMEEEIMDAVEEAAEEVTSAEEEVKAVVEEIVEEAEEKEE